jgi:MFS superfamily sulfate permease-like transporter
MKRQLLPDWPPRLWISQPAGAIWISLGIVTATLVAVHIVGLAFGILVGLVLSFVIAVLRQQLRLADTENQHTSEDVTENEKDFRENT